MRPISSPAIKVAFLCFLLSSVGCSQPGPKQVTQESMPTQLQVSGNLFACSLFFGMLENASTDDIAKARFKGGRIASFRKATTEAVAANPDRIPDAIALGNKNFQVLKAKIKSNATQTQNLNAIEEIVRRCAADAGIAPK